MKLFTTAAMALALMGVAAAAHADDQKNGQQKGHPAPPAHAAPPARAAPSHGPVQSTGGAHFNTQSGAPGGQHFNAQGGPAGGQHFNGQAAGAGGPSHGQGQATGQIQRGNGQHFNGQAGGSASLGFQNHAARGRDQGRVGYSANVFSRQYHAQRQFRFGGYRSYPTGWAWRSWSYGQFLPFGWYAPQYYLSWNDYGLPAPPVGCEWVAEGPDAVLVDVWTGQVLSVYSGVFYWNG